MLIAPLIEVAFALCMLLIEVTMALGNLCALLVELVLGLFIEGFALGRLVSSRQAARQEGKPPPHPEPSGSSFAMSALVLVVALALIFSPEIGRAIRTREITLRLEDARPLSFAGVIVETEGGREERQRTDASGRLRIPRWGFTGLRLRDVRYEAKAWKRDEIGKELIARPSALSRQSERWLRFLRTRPERK